VAEVIDVLDAQVRAGKIRAFGCSNWTLERLREAQNRAAAAASPFCGNQLMWSLAAPEPDALPFPGMVAMDDATYRHHHDSGMPAVAYSAQANGFFAKLSRGGVAGLPDPLRRRYGSRANIATLPRLASIADNLGVSVTAASVAYLLNHEFPTYAIVGCTDRAQLADTLQAADLRLDAESIRALGATVSRRPAGP
jgi:aryl-alcohol dehydrogenase-like predicted oxidoreductase